MLGPGIDPSRGSRGFCGSLWCIHHRFGGGPYKERMSDCVCFATAEAAWDAISYSWPGVGGSDVCPQDFKTLSLWGPLYCVHVKISYGSTEAEHVVALWMDVVKDYDYEILYHPDKANMVADALSRKSVGFLVGEMCMSISIDSLILGLIREAQAEEVQKENWK